MRMAGFSTIDLGVFGISVVITAGAREGWGPSHGCPRSAAGAHRGPGVPQLEGLESFIGRR